jgi:ELWxxDGT repeat protein
MRTPFHPGCSLDSSFLRQPFLALLLVALASSSVSAQSLRRIVSDNGDPIRDACFLTEFDGKLYFRCNNLDHGNNVELWVLDGTVARMAAEIRSGPTGSDPADFAVLNDTLYFCANNGSGPKLWQYHADSGASIAPGAASLAGNPQALFAYAGKLYFRATRFSDIGIELWSFDGAKQTPIDLYPGKGSSYPQHFIGFNGMMFFNANGAVNQGTELWCHNGTGMPTEAARIYPNNGSSPENFAVFDGQLYFSAYDGVHGRELWRYDGSQATLAADIVPGGQYSSSNPSGLTVFGGKLYFSATDGVHGYELWSFDGATAAMVAEINPTPDPGNGDTFLMDASPNELTVFDGQLYFSAIDGSHGRELWAYDGTAVRLVNDLNPGSYGSEVTELTVFNGALYFSADDGYNPSLANLEPAVFAMVAMPRATLSLELRPAPAGGFVLVVANSDGSPVTGEQMAAIRMIKSEDPSLPVEQWQPWSGPRILANGVIEIQPAATAGVPRCFYRAAVTP